MTSKYRALGASHSLLLWSSFLIVLLPVFYYVNVIDLVKFDAFLHELLGVLGGVICSALFKARKQIILIQGNSMLL